MDFGVVDKLYGSGFLKHDRLTVNEDDFRDFKFSKIPSTNSSNLIEGQNMLSFSQNSALPYYSQTSSPFIRNTGYGSSDMSGMLSGVRGPFTPSQWMELEHQALIYKYINANVPIPSYLLNPIRKALESAGFATFSGLRPNALGWGGFHLGFSNTDPEPGRCRRTDGKKWRCSRDAVSDQKYCERHMNRGRHRSRKPVEGQNGHSGAGNTNTSGKLPPVAAGGGASSLGLSRNGQINNLQSGVPNVNSLLEKENGDGPYHQATILSMASPKLNANSIPKHPNPYKECSRSEFGLVCSDSLLNPLNTSFNNLDDQENKSQQHALLQFMDEWPQNQTERPNISWPEIDRTQLSISIPNDEIQATQMGLSVGTNWVPSSWEPSMGGPLGEVLHTTNNSTGNFKNAEAVNLIESWDHGTRLVSSPTGVLQRGAFGSLSNSSAGSSPRAVMNPSLP